jgi:hypothetical protein
VSEHEEIRQLALDLERRTKVSSPHRQGETVEIVRLEKAFSWQQTYNRYPFYLSKANPDRSYTFEEVYTIIFETERPGRKKDRATWVRNTFGLERDVATGQPVAKGIGLMEKVGANCYRLSAEAIELGDTFAEDRYDDEWLRVFASILARNDIRSRCVLYYLGKLGWSLQFPTSPTKGGFFKNSVPTLLISPSGETLSLFDYDRDAEPRYSFTSVLQNVAYEALGPFLHTKLKNMGLSLGPNLHFVGALSKGVTKTEPSSDNLNVYLKQTLSIFKDLGVITYVPGQQAWGIDYARAQAVFSADIVVDLFTSLQGDRFLEALQEVYEKLADAEGLASVRQMRDWVCDLLGISAGERVRYFNDRMAYYMSPEQGKLSIVKEFHAQASPEDCLFYDLNKEYVALLF